MKGCGMSSRQHSGLRLYAVVLCVLLVAMLTAPFNAEAKTRVAREYAKSSFSIINILDSAIPELGCKITALDRNKGTVAFMTNNKREMEIQITANGKDACSVEISGSAWFSDEPETVAARIHAKINDVLIKREAQRISSAQKPIPVQKEKKPKKPEPADIEESTQEANVIVVKEETYRKPVRFEDMDLIALYS